MRIALLTIWHEENYGAELQAYATSKILRKLGHDVQFIDIRLSDISELSFRGKIGNLLSSLGPSKKKFERFWSKFFVTTIRYHSASELQANPPIADVYMVGSDQVWNPEITRSLSEVFFLNFGPNSVKRISYASSFGTENWAGNDINEIKQLLHRFHSLSCREKSGVQILKNVFGCTATNVLDPTLLFENYEELTGDLKEENTLVYYPLSSFPQLSSFAEQTAHKLGLSVKNANWQTYICGSAIWDRNSILVYYPLSSFPQLSSFAEQTAHKLGLSVKNANWQTYICGSAIWDRNSIEGWIKDIAQAKFVITPSFHGLAMSIIHHRQFAVIVANKSRATRMVSLLDSLDLSDRIYSSFEELESAKPWENSIKYDLVDEKLAKLREASINYLQESLQK